MDVQLIELDKIDPNPWQPRTTEDAEQVEKIARSIAADGLLQAPVARCVDGRYQLAFGHTRYKAYQYLTHKPPEWFRENGYAALYYGQMPTHVLDLTDEAMYRYAVSENIQRKDLDAVEEAQAMRRAMIDFGYNSKQVGALFGKSDATVRGLVRLLDLPAEAQAKIRTGEISQGTARQLLAVTGLVKPEAINAMALNLASSPGQSSSSVAWDISQALNKAHAVKMGKDNAGDELWPLDWQPAQRIPPSAESAKLWKGPKALGSHKRPIAEVFDDLADYGRVDLWEQAIADYPDYAEAADFLRALSNPPACAGCPHLAKHEGLNWCGSKPCHTRKADSWMQSELSALSQATGLRIYDAAADGDFLQVDKEHEYGPGNDLKHIQERNAEKRARYAAGDPGLRLKPIADAYYGENWLTGRIRIKVVDVGEHSKAQFAADAKRAQENAAYRQRQETNGELYRLNQGKTREFVIEQAYQYFVAGFEKMDNLAALMDVLGIEEKDFSTEKTRKDKLAALRLELARRALNNIVDWQMTQQGAPFVAKHLQGVATTWGIRLPDDWLEIAARYAVDGAPAVATETVQEETEDEAEYEEA